MDHEFRLVVVARSICLLCGMGNAESAVADPASSTSNKTGEESGSFYPSNDSGRPQEAEQTVDARPPDPIPGRPEDPKAVGGDAGSSDEFPSIKEADVDAVLLNLRAAVATSDPKGIASACRRA